MNDMAVLEAYARLKAFGGGIRGSHLRRLEALEFPWQLTGKR